MKRIVVGLVLCALALPALAQNCRSILGRQSPDAASIKGAEHAWLDAHLHGGTEYLGCLLVPDYVSVSAQGVGRDKATIIELARKNEGKTTPIPDIPEPKIELYGDTAVVRFDSPASADGKYSAMYSSDVFAFQDGAWHAVYSQHTNREAVVNK